MLMKSMIPLAAWILVACSQASPADQAANGSTQTPPAAPPKGGEVVIPNDVPPGVPQPQIPAEVNSLLDRLESSAKDLQSFTADVKYEKEDPILGRKELRTGNIIYYQDPETKEKSFAILFDSSIVGNVKRSDVKQYIFNGRWLVEVDPKEKQFIKREIVPPGKQLDPLKLGEGPFPLPIGQNKADVLTRFQVTVAAIPEQGLLKDLANVQGGVDSLSLVPKPGVREAKQFAKVDLYYDRELLLPLGIRTEETNGETKVVRLVNVKRNPQLTPEQMARLDIKEPDPREWRIDVRPWSESE